MLCFDSDGTYAPISPLKKPSVGRRSFLRQITQATILSGVIMLVFMFGRDLLWSSSTNSYTIDPRDLDIVQSLCNAQNGTFNNNNHSGILMATDEQEESIMDRQVPSYLITPPSDYQPDIVIPTEVWTSLPSKSVLYMVVRNENLQEARSAMRSIEDRFNRHFKYPWVLLNNQDFTPAFQKYIRKVTQAPIYFGKIDAQAWSYPNWIDIRTAEDHMDIMYALNVYRGGSLSFRQLLRYQSGLAIHHPLFRDVDYLWRVEPGSDITCDMIDFDPFVYMKKHNKTLGFTLTMREAPEAVENLWDDTRQFMDEYSHHILPGNETIMPWITGQDRINYNMCHLWSNFEIIKTDFLRSKAYQDYFEFLDRKGGFFYERWGDNPVRTMAVAMFLPRNQIQFFNRIGYTHSVATHCPVNQEDNIRCSCDMFESYDFHENSCTADLLQLLDDPALDSMVTFAEKQIAVDYPVPKVEEHEQEIILNLIEQEQEQLYPTIQKENSGGVKSKSLSPPSTGANIIEGGQVKEHKLIEQQAEGSTESLEDIIAMLQGGLEQQQNMDDELAMIPITEDIDFLEDVSIQQQEGIAMMV
ncbi:nucleotide-diphospho-sugar transferase [Phascolomyces articulosus]|uniref:Nucleotide-diphospho-sugar transferase n=1 Tax=Phascolomyces articulosus TaxID=60185 RepID=A0AAD5K6G5_9FUNG|nr:nucleotide-diphospho-sugar transferase [Phascolomyces articulosus]